MIVNPCKICGGNIIDVITDCSGTAKAVCRRCGNTGRPARKEHIRSSLWGAAQEGKQPQTVQELAVDYWNGKNPK